MEREAWHAAVHGVTKSWTRLSSELSLKNMSVLSQHKADAPQMLAYSRPNNSDGKSRQRRVVFTTTAP